VTAASRTVFLLSAAGLSGEQPVMIRVNANAKPSMYFFITNSLLFAVYIDTSLL
jgi:hypothetical protein